MSQEAWGDDDEFPTPEQVEAMAAWIGGDIADMLRSLAQQVAEQSGQIDQLHTVIKVVNEQINIERQRAVSAERKLAAVLDASTGIYPSLLAVDDNQR